MVDDEIVQIVSCPRCFNPLSSKSGLLTCRPCQLSFPEVAEIPWIFPFPERLLGSWKQKIEHQLLAYQHEVAKIDLSLQQPQLSPLTKERLQSMRQGYIHNSQVIAELMAPLFKERRALKLNFLEAVKSELPLQTKLFGYESNVHRDWVWGDEEHRQTFALVEKLVSKGKPKAAKVLIMGSGAGRLPYDLSIAWPDAQIFAIDFNPFLTIFAKRMSDGKKITFYEFPLAPLNLKSLALRNECKAPKAASGNLHWLLTDALNPPFQAGRFDFVLTPWFIDVVPQDLKQLSARVNFLLKDGGQWLNWGPYGFLSAPLAHQYSQEEVLALVAENGFALEMHDLVPMPYLHSPHSGQKRTETLLAFTAKQTKSGERGMAFKTTPAWFDDIDLVIPASDQVSQLAYATQVQTQVFKEIDGRKTLRQIAEQMGKAHQIPFEEALGALMTLLRQSLGF